MNIVVVCFVVAVITLEFEMTQADKSDRLRQCFDLKAEGIIDDFLGVHKTGDFGCVVAFQVNRHRHGAGDGVPDLSTDSKGEHIFIRIVELAWAGLRLLSEMRGYHRAILIDSLLPGEYDPGTVVRLDAPDLVGSLRLNAFHGLDFATTMALGRALGWSIPGDVKIIAVQGERFDRFETELTPAVQHALGVAVDRVLSLLPPVPLSHAS